ncbi:MAG: phosphohydrolase, partial [Candidatus Marinimicrobia bacterium]|nr:phosphohydrolase [Candidatus Neomarinimicrobiota bacterium]
EAAVRSIKKPNYQNIIQMVNKLFKKRLTENQLDICPLTLADIDKIQDAVIPILTGMYHVRIEYPDDKKHNGIKNGK